MGVMPRKYISHRKCDRMEMRNEKTINHSSDAWDLSW